MHRGNSEMGGKPVSVRAQAPSAHVYIPRTDKRWAKGQEGEWKIEDEWGEGHIVRVLYDRSHGAT